MTQTQQPPYTCISCGMRTFNRKDMRRHLYNRKKPCPMSANPIPLTDEIREYILANRKYHIPAPEPTIYQTINQNNSINNMIVSMSAEEKLTKYMEFTNNRVTNVSDAMEERFERRALAFSSNKRDGMQLRKDDILDMIDEVTSLCSDNFQGMNIMYEPKYDRLKMYESGEWKDVLLKNGCRKLLNYLQESVLDDYEKYLMQRVVNTSAANARVSAHAKQCICDYYRFLGCFDVEPYPYQEAPELTEVQQDLYARTSSVLTRTDIVNTRKEMIDILKKNSKRNLDDLNQKIASLFHMDEEFKKLVMKQDSV